MANSKSAKSSKSNKTAHVLNLLTEPGETAPTSAPSKPHSAPSPSSSTANTEEAAETIRSALEEELLAELASEPVPAPQPEPESVPAPQPEPEPVPAPQPKPEPVPAPQPEPEPVPAPQPEPEPVPAPEIPAEQDAEAPSIDRVTYLNVMQALVEDKVDKYMERFHMCRCPRCRTDVIALTLTSLPAKYIVVPENEGVPMLSIYEGRYSPAVTAQLMWACQKVAEHPRHALGEDGGIRLGAPRKDD